MSEEQQQQTNSIVGRFMAVAVPMSDDDGKTALVRWGEAGDNKIIQAQVWFEIIEGEHKGRRLPWLGFFGPNSWERTLQSFRYMGWRGTDIMKPGDLDQIVEIQVGPHEYDGKTYYRVEWVNRPGGGKAFKMSNPLSPDKARAFAARVAGRAKSIEPVDGKRYDRLGPAEGRPSAPPNGQRAAAPDPRNDDWGETGDKPPPGEEDDLPF